MSGAVIIGTSGSTTTLNGTTYINKIDTITPTNSNSIFESLTTGNLAIADNIKGNIYVGASSPSGTNNFIIIGKGGGAATGTTNMYLKGKGVYLADDGGIVNIGNSAGSITINSPLTPSYSYPVTGNKIGTIKKGTCSLANNTPLTSGISYACSTITSDYTGVYIATANLYYVNVANTEIIFTEIEMNINGGSIPCANNTPNKSRWEGFNLSLNTVVQLNAGDNINLRFYHFIDGPGSVKSSTNAFRFDIIRVA
jgi:hypothetical protein